MSNENHSATRGGFLSVVTVGLGAAIGGVLAVPAVGYVLAPATQGTMFKPVSLGPRSKYTSESGFSPTAAAYIEDPAQPLVSSRLAYVHAKGHKNRDWLALDAMFVAWSNGCTHVRCPAPATSGGFACPATEACSTSGVHAPRVPPSDPSTASSRRSERTATFGHTNTVQCRTPPRMSAAPADRGCGVSAPSRPTR